MKDVVRILLEDQKHEIDSLKDCECACACACAWLLMCRLCLVKPCMLDTRAHVCWWGPCLPRPTPAAPLGSSLVTDTTCCVRAPCASCHLQTSTAAGEAAPGGSGGSGTRHGSSSSCRQRSLGQGTRQQGLALQGALAPVAVVLVALARGRRRWRRHWRCWRCCCCGLASMLRCTAGGGVERQAPGVGAVVAAAAGGGAHSVLQPSDPPRTPPRERDALCACMRVCRGPPSRPPVYYACVWTASAPFLLLLSAVVLMAVRAHTPTILRVLAALAARQSSPQ
jgi:hypothetical protein